MSSWTPSHRSGDAELDAHHRDLLDLLGGAAAAVGRRDAPAGRELLARFQATCLAHFALEERALASLPAASLPARAAQAHLDSHAEFLDDLGRLRAELSARGPTTLVRLWLSSRLVEWLRFHTRTMDAALAEAMAGARRAVAPQAAGPQPPSPP
jgi:hemerythrin-like metal-binding protein